MVIKNKSRYLQVAVAVALCIPIAAEASFFKKLVRAIKHATIASIVNPLEHFINTQRVMLQGLSGHFSWSSVVNVMLVDYQNLQNLGFALVSPFSSCDQSSVSSPYGSVTTYCFDSEDRGNVQAGMNRLVAYNANSGYLNFNGQWLSPVGHSVTWTTSFYDMDSPTEIRALFPEFLSYPGNFDCQDVENLLGCHFASLNSAGTTGLAPSAMMLTPVRMASVILHEAHHSPYGGHTAGNAGDSNCSGPYALEAAYLRDAVNGAVPNLTAAEIAEANGAVSYITANRVPSSCQTSILSRPGFSVSGASYVPPPVSVCVVGYDESGQQVVGCAVRQAASVFTPPPAPAPIPVCFVDESGQICY
jgi:hypothetical protein